MDIISVDSSLSEYPSGAPSLLGLRVTQGKATLQVFPSERKRIITENEAQTSDPVRWSAEVRCRASQDHTLQSSRAVYSRP